jgi:hypothetical protein
MSAINPILDQPQPQTELEFAKSPWASERAVVIGLWVAWILACVPLFFISILPAVDYPNHLARVYILAHGLSQPGYAQFYQAHWTFLPNLALDLVMVPLAKIMPVKLAGRLFLCGMFGLTVYGGARLNKALAGKWSWLALAPAFLIYNRILAYGFLNYLTGIALLLLAFAFHIENKEAKTSRRLLLETVFLCGLFTCHLVAMALYIVCVLTYDVGRWRTAKTDNKQKVNDLAVVFAPAFVLIALFLRFSPSTAEAAAMDFRPWDSKIKLLHMVFQTGQGLWDYVFGILAVVLLGWLVFSKRAKLNKSMSGAIWLLLAIFVVSPIGFSQASNIDSRLPVVLSLFLFVAIVPRKTFPAQTAGICILSLLGLRCLTTSIHYAAWNRQIDAAVADFRQIPAGSVVLATSNKQSNAFDSNTWDPPLMHLDCLLLLERPVLCQNLFAFPSEQPLLKKAPYDNIGLTQRVGGTTAKNLKDYGWEASRIVTAVGVETHPQYLYYLREPGALQTSPALNPLVVRPRYVLFKLIPHRPDASEQQETQGFAAQQMKHNGN